MISVARKTLKKGLLIDTELPKERIYYKRQGKFIHLMWAPKGFFRTDDSEIAVCMKKQYLELSIS